ncbi:LuxR C-terminal-related transcriptional regulator [Sorangium sp. So ce448]|uniref:helix-turn-helix transcriptional regulator n=1 Tax=Sorangium sp. So ce448 TaxID=3133314 RepID=UPI003F6365A9
MAHAASRGSRQQQLLSAVLEALHQTPDVHGVFEVAFPLLAQIVPVDQGALCISNPALAGGYDWATLGFAVDWFSAYPNMAPHDFVRRAVAGSPNVVLRDSEMITRAELEVNMMYRRSIDVGMPLEQVMSVMLAGDAGWHAGINLYRGRRRPFSDRERDALQQFAPLFARAVRKCKLLAEVSRRGTLLESILAHQGFEAVVMASCLEVIDRTAGAAAILGRWFAPAELERGELPRPLRSLLEETARRDEGRVGPLPPWTRQGAGGARLEVTILPLPDAPYRTVWAILLREVQRPENSWDTRLTPAERAVAARVLRGWDNQLIAQDLRCESGTVKKHLQHIFDKLGISSRTALCALAMRAR